MRPHFPDPGTEAPQVKICGITRLSDAEVCAQAGADAIGINFWPNSKRFVTLESALDWLPEVPESLCRVAVLVNATREEVEKIWGSGQIDALQFHGDEPPEFIVNFQNRGIPCLRAAAVRTESEIEALRSHPCAHLLLDAFQPGVYGGTGTMCDWELARRAVAELPEKRIVLSGGLTPGNVAEAVRKVHPLAVDVASGVESAPRVKNITAVGEFVRAAKEALA